MPMFTALYNGYLPKFKIGGVESQGLVSKGDVVEYTGIRRLWLEPIIEKTAKKAAGKTPGIEDITRTLVINQLTELKVNFSKDMSLEQLQAMLVTAKGQPA